MKIGDLRKKLDEMQVDFAEKGMAEYMGEFEDQEIYVPTYEWNKPERYDLAGAFDYRGMGRDLVVYWDVTGLGLFIDHE